MEAFDDSASRTAAATSTAFGASECTQTLSKLMLSSVPSTASTTPSFRTRRTRFPAESFMLERAKPVYETFPGWSEDLTAARKPADLPVAARRYVDRVGELLGLPVSIVSVGPDREQTISLR